MFDNNENLYEETNNLLPNTYEAALADLQNTLKVIDNQGTNLDDLLEHVQRANELVQYCKDKLRTIEGDVQKIL